MKQKIIFFDTEGKYPPRFNPANDQSGMFFLQAFDGAGWESNDSLPEVVERMNRSIQKQWGTDIPCGIFDDLTHSIIGYINFLTSVSKVEKNEGVIRDVYKWYNVYPKVLSARISFGPESKQTMWDRKSFDRMHISAFGRRVINPQDEEYAGSNNVVSENLYFSLRWIDGLFKDHSSGVVGSEPSESFDELRTTYFVSRVVEPVVDELEEKNLKELIQEFPQIRLARPVSESYDDAITKCTERARKGFDLWHRSGRYKHHNDAFPDVGYELVLDILSKHGGVASSDYALIKNMGVEEGVDYFLEKIVPSVKNFVDGKQ